MKKILYCIMFTCLFGMLSICFDGIRDETVDADTAVVLGNLAYPNGPSEPLQARLDAAITLNQQHKIKYFFVSGGIENTGTDEAKVMARYLKAHGIPENKIIEDNQGDNTRATANNLASFLKQKNLTSTIIVSQYFHISRTRLALKQAGITAIGNIHPSYFTLRDIYSIPREMFGFLVYWTQIK